MSHHSWNEVLMAIGAIGVVSLLILSIINSIKHGQFSGLLESIVYGANDALLKKRLFLWGYILFWSMFLLGLIAGLLVT